MVNNMYFELLDGETGELIYLAGNAFPPGCPGEVYGGIAARRDEDGDDFPNFWLMHLGCIGSVPDMVTHYTSAPLSVQTFGDGCATTDGLVPRIACSGVATIGTDFTFYLSRVAPSSAAWLVLGTSNTIWNGMDLPLDLSPYGIPGCELAVAADAIVPTTTYAVRAGEGVGALTLSIPNDVALQGTTHYGQWLVSEALQNTPVAPSSGGAGFTPRQTQNTMPAPLWSMSRGLAVTIQ
jgi:hypothetical protein